MGWIKQTARTLLPAPAIEPLRRMVRRVQHAGISRHCPFCHSRLRHFLPFGLVPRPEARCPVCDSLERHRLILLYLRRRTTLFEGGPHRLLHVAPEPMLSHVFRRCPHIDYVSADLMDPRAIVRMDITEMPFTDDNFDAICCSHVLEHVEDDRTAMAELHRVLRPTGWAILQVPITAAHTWADPAIQTPEQRLEAYGQADHVRRYGPDYRDRLEDAGFGVQVVPFARSLPEREVRRYGLAPNADIYLCRKNPGQGRSGRSSSP